MPTIPVTELEVGMVIDLEKDSWANSPTEQPVFEFENAVVESIETTHANDSDNNETIVYIVNFSCGGGEYLIHFPHTHILTVGE